MIDRCGLVAEHGVTIREPDPRSPLSVGNGEVCFTVDSTGLQTWPERYPVPDPAGGVPGTLLSTLSNWGWHATPGGESLDVAHCTRPYQTARGLVRCVDLSDFPAIAMCAARLGQPGVAVDALMLDVSKNQFLPNGHNRQDASLPVYLPANGGLLAAVAVMAAGPGSQPTGFPDDGSWRVEHEGLTRPSGEKDE